MKAYLEFLREVLIREGNRGSLLLDQFSKSFSHRYNLNILAPYLKDEKSKMNKEDRTALMGLLLAINYGDRVTNFIGLEEQAQRSLDTEISEELPVHELDLEQLFRSSYLPAQFTLIEIKKSDQKDQLIVKGVDIKTNLTIEAQLLYKDIQLSVVDLKIQEHQKLADYINALIKNERFSLNKVLQLLQENKDIAQQVEKLDLSLCTQLKEQFKDDLKTCSATDVEIHYGKAEGQKSSMPQLSYHFELQKGVIRDFEVSDPVLQTQLLREIDLKTLDANASYYLISSIVGYRPQEEES